MTTIGRPVAVVVLGALPSFAADEPEGVLFEAMRDELDRSMQSLTMQDMEKPFFLAYRVDEVEGFRVSARFGALENRSPSIRRTLTVELRVGSSAFDNTNFLFGNYRSGGSTSLPLDDDYHQLRRQIWLATDFAYKSAHRALANKRAALQNRSREELPDFAPADPTRSFDQPDPSVWPIEDAASLARDLSAVFKEIPGIDRSSVQAMLDNRRSYYVNSEGSAYVHERPSVQVSAWASTQTADGTFLEDVERYQSRFDELPALEALAPRVRAMAEALSGRREAESLDRYSGPVLFEGQAAAELFADVFSPRLLAVRVPSADGARFERTAARARNPFVDKIGARVLPRFLDVRDDPTADRFGEHRLHGGYRVDDEGVPAAPTILIERGRLKTLLTTRNPVEGVEASAGNRRGIGPLPSNLIVGTGNGLSRNALGEELMALTEERGNEFGIVVRRLSGRSIVRAVKVYPDGREVPIRKAVLSGFSVSAFKDIVAVSETPTVHTLRFPTARTSTLRATSAVYGSPRYDTTGSVVLPDLLFEEVTLRRPLGNPPKPPVAGHPYFEDG